MTSARSTERADPGDAHQEALGEVLGFTHAELEANREGRVTRGQAWSLVPSVAFALAFTIGAALLAVGAARYARGVLRWWGLLASVAVMLLLIGLIVYPSVRDLARREVAVVTGRVEVGAVGKGRGKAVLRFPGATLKTNADPDRVRRILRAEEYRAYYLRRTSRLLSIEPAGGWRPE